MAVTLDSAQQSAANWQHKSIQELLISAEQQLII